MLHERTEAQMEMLRQRVIGREFQPLLGADTQSEILVLVIPIEVLQRDAGGDNGVKTEVVNRTTTNVQEEKRALVVLNDMPTVEDVAFALNSMGATPRELMSILQSIKDAGALNAELVLE